MLMHTRKGTTIVTQQEKVTNETRQRMNNLFQRLCSVRSFCCRESIFSYLQQTVFILSQANFYLTHFLKVSTLPWKNWQQTASWSFSWSFSPATIDFQNSPSSDFYMAPGPLATLSPTWPLRGQKSLPGSLRNSLNSIPRWLQWFLRSFVIF